MNKEWHHWRSNKILLLYNTKYFLIREDLFFIFLFYPRRCINFSVSTTQNFSFALELRYICMFIVVVVVVSEPNGGMRCARLCCPHLQAFCKLQPMTHRMFSTLYVRIKVSAVGEHTLCCSRNSFFLNSTKHAKVCNRCFFHVPLAL